MAKKIREIPEESLWTAKEVAAFLKIPANTVYTLDDLPRITLSPGRVRFVPSIVRRWALARQAT